jgi:hypothetical protein
MQSWGFAPVNPRNPADALAYANNRCYAFYLVGSGQLRPAPGQTHSGSAAHLFLPLPVLDINFYFNLHCLSLSSAF